MFNGPTKHELDTTGLPFNQENEKTVEENREKYTQYTKEMEQFVQRTKDGGALTRDDKCKRHVWSITPETYATVLANYLTNSPSWWIEEKEAYVANGEARKQLEQTLGEDLAREYGIKNIADTTIPIRHREVQVL